MQREPIVFVGTSDWSGHFRGKSFPVTDLAARLVRGVGIAPTNLFISAFGPIHYTPFGTAGETFLIPDPESRVTVPFAGEPGAVGAVGEDFFLGDFITLDGTPWHFCPRLILRRALERLHEATGLRVLATFEQEFTHSGVAAQPMRPYELGAYREQGAFGETLLAVLRQAGVVPDTFLAEYGAAQFEVTVAPAVGVRAADEAVITRELTQAVAHRFGARASFAPLPDLAAASNGTHIHWSFLDDDDRPVMFDANRPWQLSAAATHFVAGVLHHLPMLCAVTAPSVASYYRLRPNRWAPTRADLAVLDRGTAVRICPGTGTDETQRARHFNVEFRVADACASPYLALAMLIDAGLEGIEQQRSIDSGSSQPLPSDLGAALSLLETSSAAVGWWGGDVIDAYVKFKRGELRSLEGFDEAEVCRRYAEVY